MKLKLDENNKFNLQYFVEYLDEEKLFEAPDSDGGDAVLICDSCGSPIYK